MIIIKKVFCILFISVLFLHAKQEINQKPFEEIILGYNHGFIKANQKAKFEHLKKYLTQEIYNKTFVWIDVLQANNTFFDSILINTKFDEIKIKQYSASLVTNEKWKYRYINIKDKEILIPETRVDYKMKYFFVILEDGTWKINHIKILDEKSKVYKK
ncbi:MAG: hypothetical protein HRT73_08605 [Flavobacteriales bacterium]|nr:hypothetical protein [Flavobacteriales bacterium]